MDNFVYPSITPSHLESTVWNEALYEQLVDNIRRMEQTWRKSKPTEDQLKFPYAHYLYKYRSVDPAHPERTEAVFAEKKLWASSIDRLNDPLEAAFVYGRGTSDAGASDAVNMMVRSNWCGCISFSADPVCPQMWAHYAAEHSGFCIEYCRLDSFLLSCHLCNPVMYRRTMPSIHEGTDMNNIFWTKSQAWEYEMEWRLRYPRANAYTAPGLLTPTGVIFGLRASEESKAFLRNCAVNVRFGETERAREPYKLQICWEKHDDG